CQNLATQLRAVYDLILQLQTHEEKLHDRAVAELQARLDRELEICHSEELKEFGTSDSRDARDASRMKDFSERYLPGTRAQLRILAKSYQDVVKGFLLMLASQADVSLQLLSFRLDFNEHYKRRDVRLVTPLTYQHRRLSFMTGTATTRHKDVPGHKTRDSAPQSGLVVLSSPTCNFTASESSPIEEEGLSVCSQNLASDTPTKNYIPDEIIDEPANRTMSKLDDATMNDNFSICISQNNESLVNSATEIGEDFCDISSVKPYTDLNMSEVLPVNVAEVSDYDISPRGVELLKGKGKGAWVNNNSNYLDPISGKMVCNQNFIGNERYIEKFDASFLEKYPVAVGFVEVVSGFDRLDKTHDSTSLEGHTDYEKAHPLAVNEENNLIFKKTSLARELNLRNMPSDAKFELVEQQIKEDIIEHTSSSDKSFTTVSDEARGDSTLDNNLAFNFGEEYVNELALNNDPSVFSNLLNSLGHQCGKETDTFILLENLKHVNTESENDGVEVLDDILCNLPENFSFSDETTLCEELLLGGESAQEGFGSVSTCGSLDKYCGQPVDTDRCSNKYSEQHVDIDEHSNKYSEQHVDIDEHSNKYSEQNVDIAEHLNKCSEQNVDIDEHSNKYSEQNVHIAEHSNKCSEQNVDIAEHLNKYSEHYVDIDKHSNKYSKQNLDIDEHSNKYSKQNLDVDELSGKYCGQSSNITQEHNNYQRDRPVTPKDFLKVPHITYHSCGNNNIDEIGVDLCCDEVSASVKLQDLEKMRPPGVHSPTKQLKNVNDIRRNLSTRAIPRCSRPASTVNSEPIPVAQRGFVETISRNSGRKLDNVSRNFVSTSTPKFSNEAAKNKKGVFQISKQSNIIEEVGIDAGYQLDNVYYCTETAVDEVATSTSEFFDPGSEEAPRRLGAEVNANKRLLTTYGSLDARIGGRAVKKQWVVDKLNRKRSLKSKRHSPGIT
ncbi:unnamed protein product, partial [Timema podura]|nr:unnamed protein product [Timema podura]